MLKGVSILPIFNPESVGYWDDFMRIYTRTAQHNYNRQIDATEYQHRLSEIRSIWARQGFKFAFGAYYNNQMIGCILGESQDKSAFVNHLYVEPEYQRNGVGFQLLRSAEAASALFFNKINLISASRADKFYQAQKYIMHTAVNGYAKDIKNAAHCQVVPVFHCTPNLAKRLSKISGHDYKTIQSETPLFVYQDAQSNICAYGTIQDKTIYSTPSNQWAHQQINKTLERHHQHMCTQR